MNNIEFKILVKSLFITTTQLTELGGYKDTRQIRYFFSGQRTIHNDFLQKIIEVDAKIDEAVSHAVKETINKKVSEVKLVAYQVEDYFEWQDDPWLFYELYLCQLSRLKTALEENNTKVNIVVFDPELYLSFIEQERLDDSQESILKWLNRAKA